MKALAYFKAHSLHDFAIQEITLPDPVPNDTDLLVRVKAISVNPVDYKIRSRRDGQDNQAVILGWDVAGIVEKTGKNVTHFKIGDEVYYAGDLTRAGGNAELHLVDYRLAAKKPKNLDFAAAAAIPLTGLTAWEALFEKLKLHPTETSTILIVGGAGGVSSMAIQLLKALTKVNIVTTASRPESSDWAKKMGANVIVDHTKKLTDELKKQGVEYVDAIFSTTHSDEYLPYFADILKPFGQICLIDDPKQLDVTSLKSKSISIHWELMFTKSLYSYHLESQGEILRRLAELIETKKIVTTANTYLRGFSAENIKMAHTLLESGKSIGKIVIDFQ